MARRGHTPKKRSGKLTITPSDFRYPGEKRLYWQGVGGVMFFFLWLAAAVWFTLRTPSGGHRLDLVIECVLWPVIAVTLCNILALRPRKQEFKQADQHSRVMSTNHPELHKTLQNFARLCGMKRAPEMYVMPADRCYIFSIPAKGGTIVASRALVAKLRPEELQAVMAHEVGHILCRHIRTELALIYIRSSNPVWKFILLPVYLMDVLMRGWMDVIDYSADRCAMLLMGGSTKVVNAAIVKLALAIVTEADISMEELDEFLSAPSDAETEHKLLERQIRARKFIDEIPNLRDRIEALSEFAKTEQAQRALEKLSQLVRPA